MTKIDIKKWMKKVTEKITFFIKAVFSKEEGLVVKNLRRIQNTRNYFHMIIIIVSIVIGLVLLSFGYPIEQELVVITLSYLTIIGIVVVGFILYELEIILEKTVRAYKKREINNV